MGCYRQESNGAVSSGKIIVSSGRGCLHVADFVFHDGLIWGVRSYVGDHERDQGCQSSGNLRDLCSKSVTHLVTNRDHAALVGFDLRQMERDVSIEVFEKTYAIAD